jgi:hypothetical protein
MRQRSPSAVLSDHHGASGPFNLHSVAWSALAQLATTGCASEGTPFLSLIQNNCKINFFCCLLAGVGLMWRLRAETAER